MDGKVYVKYEVGWALEVVDDEVAFILFGSKSIIIDWYTNINEKARKQPRERNNYISHELTSTPREDFPSSKKKSRLNIFWWILTGDRKQKTDTLLSLHLGFIAGSQMPKKKKKGNENNRLLSWNYWILIDEKISFTPCDLLVVNVQSLNLALALDRQLKITGLKSQALKSQQHLSQ